MPPKKKKGKGGGKKKGKKSKDDVKLELEEKYTKTMGEITALKDQLAFRRELTVRAKSAKDDMWQKMEETKQALMSKEEEQKDVASDMTRQYKTMQTQLGVNIYQLEAELQQTRHKLEQTETELKRTHDAKEKIVKEKDAVIADLQMKIESMGMSYETELHNALDNLVGKLDLARLKWEHESTMIQARNKNTLLEFGLNPLDI